MNISRTILTLAFAAVCAAGHASDGNSNKSINKMEKKILHLHRNGTRCSQRATR